MKLVSNRVDAIILAIGVPLALLLGMALGHVFVSTNEQIEHLEDGTRIFVSNVNEPNFCDIVAQSIKSVVHVRCPEWQGSGFIIDKHMVETARHVVDDVEDFEITLYDGTIYHGTRAISAKDYDVATIWIDEELPEECIAKLGSVKDCKVGQDVFVIGSPYGKDIGFNTVTKGIISGLDREWDFIDWNGEPYGWQIAFTTDSATYPGNSGGAIFTTDGKVRGIIVGGAVPCLIAAMPCDLFLSDIELIRQMFLMDKYQFEESSIPEWQNDYDYLSQRIDLIQQIQSENSDAMKYINDKLEEIECFYDELIREIFLAMHNYNIEHSN